MHSSLCVIHFLTFCVCEFFICRKENIDRNMAAVGLWRQITFWLWLSCLLLAVYSAPVNEDGATMIEVNDQSDDNDLGPAIEAIAKAKREARKKSSLRSSNGRTHYRFPNTIKRSGGVHDEEDDFDMDEAGEEEFSDSIAGYLAADDETPVDLDDLAKEIALNILMEEADKSREDPPSNLKKKKAAPAAHRPRNNSADDKRRKRMNSLMNQLLEEKEKSEVEEGDDYDNQIAEHSAGPDDNNEANESLATEGDDDEEDDEVVSRSELRKLFNDGLQRHELNALLSQLERSHEYEEFKSEKKKRSGSDWRKLPRATLRWRFLHSQGQEGNEPSYGRQSADDEEMQDKSVPFEDRFFGRGFHRVGNIQDEPIRNIHEEAAKRVQHPLKTKNAISVIRKRSIASLQNSGEKKAESGSALQMLRKRRNSEMKTDEENKKNETNPLALPSTEPNNSNLSQVKQKSDKDAQVHTGVIRKKSVDWDDYFGYDKRSGRAEGEAKNEEAMRNYLESDYYKTMAGSLAFRRKRGPMENHAGHISGMKKRNNVTVSWEKKKKRFRSMEGGADDGYDDAEDVLDAAIRVIEERRERNNIDRVREQLVAELVDNLDEDELDQMTERLTEEVAKALYQEEEDEEMGVERDEVKRLTVNKKLKNMKKKKQNMSKNDERRKRFAIKRSGRHRTEFNGAESNRKKFKINNKTITNFLLYSVIQSHFLLCCTSEDDDCVIAEQVVSTCNMVSHLYGGYRPVLSDACHRHQACFICVSQYI